MTKRIAALVGLVVWVAACAAPPMAEKKGSTSAKLEGRWEPPQSDASGTYEGVNGEGCSGGLKSGTQALGEQLKQQFNTTYGGYACRANTASTSQLSIHGVGRALDVTADSGLGDQVANYLVENASTLGIQLIIWNHTVWKITPSGPTSRQYTGPNPHTDHVHAEVTTATAENGPGTGDGTGSADGTGDEATWGQDPSATADGGVGDDGQGYNEDGSGYYGDPSSGYDEYECATDTDCDPNGSLICDQGYCSY